MSSLISSFLFSVSSPFRCIRLKRECRPQLRGPGRPSKKPTAGGETLLNTAKPTNGSSDERAGRVVGLLSEGDSQQIGDREVERRPRQAALVIESALPFHHHHHHHHHHYQQQQEEEEEEWVGGRKGREGDDDPSFEFQEEGEEDRRISSSSRMYLAPTSQNHQKSQRSAIFHASSSSSSFASSSSSFSEWVNQPNPQVGR